MSARPGFTPVVIPGGRGRIEGCPSEDVLVLYGAGLPRDDDDQGELLDGWNLTLLDAHVDGCSTCREAASRTSELLKIVRDEPLAEPGGEFWDDLTEGVMRSIDGGERRGAPRGNVVPLRAVPTPPAEVVTTRSYPTLWRLALGLAAALALAIGMGVLLEQPLAPDAPTPRVETAVPEPSRDDAMPDRRRAEAVAAELGISAEPLDISAAAAGDVVSGDISLPSASLAWLVDGLADDDMEVLELSLPGSDPLLDLIALADLDLAEILRSLES